MACALAQAQLSCSFWLCARCRLSQAGCLAIHMLQSAIRSTHLSENCARAVDVQTNRHKDAIV
eukprot:5192412-Amphidinium_carterae.1